MSHFYWKPMNWKYVYVSHCACCPVNGRWEIILIELVKICSATNWIRYLACWFSFNCSHHVSSQVHTSKCGNDPWNFAKWQDHVKDVLQWCNPLGPVSSNQGITVNLGKSVKIPKIYYASYCYSSQTFRQLISGSF